MDLDNAKNIIKDFFENTPSKDIWEKCLTDLLIEKNNIINNEESNKDLIDKIDKVIESIQMYLSVTRK
jgi:hypothetical protein